MEGLALEIRKVGARASEPLWLGLVWFRQASFPSVGAISLDDIPVIYERIFCNFSNDIPSLNQALELTSVSLLF